MYNKSESALLAGESCTSGRETDDYYARPKWTAISIPAFRHKIAARVKILTPFLPP